MREDGHDRKQLHIFGISIDALSLSAAAKSIAETASSARTMNYVVTPNVDHLIILRENSFLREAYKGAAFVLADGWPVVLASHLVGDRLPGRVAGSDLVPEVLSYANISSIPLKVFILGGMNDVPERAANWVTENYPNIEVVGSYSPPMGFERSEAESESIVHRIVDSGANFLIVGLGAPKQELWVYKNRDILPPGVAVCAGATVDFMAGSVRRAPRWMRLLYLEWLHRLASDPGRLLKRYVKDALIFPIILLKEIIGIRRRKEGVTK